MQNNSISLEEMIRESGAQINDDKALDALEQFIEFTPKSLEILQAAPTSVQKQLLSSYQTSRQSISNIWDMNRFLLAAEATNYNSMLLDSKNLEKQYLTGSVDNCLLDSDCVDRSKLSENTKDLLEKAWEINHRMINSPHMRLIISGKPGRGKIINGVQPASTHPSPHISTWSDNGSIEDKFYTVPVSTLFMLCEYFGSATVLDIVIAFEEGQRASSLGEIIYLLPDWDSHKDYPIEWILEVDKEKLDSLSSSANSIAFPGNSQKLDPTIRNKFGISLSH